jgi:hypothetical protein
VRKFARKKRRARRKLAFRAVLTAVLALIAVTTGSRSGLEVSEALWGSAAAVSAWRLVGAGRRVWRLERTPPPPPAPGPLPPPESVARPAMERLQEREQVLADLVGHLGPAAGDTPRVAADAAAALRAHAARATSVDRARRGAPPAALPGVDAALAVLMQQLDDGIAGYEALITALAEAVCATATFHTTDPLLAQRLQEATDALAGLAAGLREIAPG